MSTQNKGEKGEKAAIAKCLKNSEDVDWCCEIFSELADEGIFLNDPVTNERITRVEDIKKAKSTIKADVILGFKKTDTTQGTSIKYFDKTNPSIINTTTRSKFVTNPKLKKFVPSFDTLCGKYLNDPVNLAKNKSEVDRPLRVYELAENEKRDIACGIAYFTFDGTGKGDASVPASAIIEMYHTDKRIEYTTCSTDEEKIQYVLDNWDRYIISIRGHKMQGNGKLRTNGVPKKGPLPEDMSWVCYYKNDDGKEYPRGALHVRIKKKIKNKK